MLLQHPAAFSSFMELFLKETGVLQQRAAWVMVKLQDIKPEWFEPWYESMVELLYQKGNHDAVDRNITRLFTCTIPTGARFEEILIDKGFRMLEDPEVSVAPKCNVMCMLLHYCKTYPELLKNLRLILERDLPHGSAAYKNRGQRILHELAELNIYKRI
jgi:hypothetical protein